MPDTDQQSLLPLERVELIRQIVKQQRSVRVTDLRERLGVSEATVRNDLARLEEEGLVKRTYGGALLQSSTRYERSFREREQQARTEKAVIADVAVRFIEPRDLIFLDVGTTTTEIARRLPAMDDIVVCTSALNIAAELERHENVTVMVTGGTVRFKQHSLVNPLGTLLIERIHADKLFLGCNGVSFESGITNSNLPEAEIKQAMMRSAKEVILVADSSKIGHVAAALIAPLAAVDRLITDSAADPAELDRIRRIGVDVIIAR